MKKQQNKYGISKSTSRKDCRREHDKNHQMRAHKSYEGTSNPCTRSLKLTFRNTSCVTQFSIRMMNIKQFDPITKYGLYTEQDTGHE